MPKKLASTSFNSTVTLASTSEMIAGQTAIVVPGAKTWLVKEILLFPIFLNGAKFNNMQLYCLPSGGTDFAAGDFGTGGFQIDGIAAAKALNHILSSNITATTVNVLARNTILNTSDAIKLAFRSGTTAPAAGDIKVMIVISGEEF